MVICQDLFNLFKKTLTINICIHLLVDIEGYAKRALLSSENEGQITERLTRRILEIKGDKVTEHHAKELAHAVMVASRAKKNSKLVYWSSSTTLTARWLRPSNGRTEAKFWLPDGG